MCAKPILIRLTQKQHFDLVALHHSVATELILNLLVTGPALLLLCAHSATHLGDLGLIAALAALVKKMMKKIVSDGRGLLRAILIGIYEAVDGNLRSRRGVSKIGEEA